MSDSTRQCGFCHSSSQLAAIGFMATDSPRYFDFCGPCLKRLTAHQLLKAVCKAIGTEYPIDDSPAVTLPPTMNPQKIHPRIYYIRGILRNRLSFCNEDRALELMAEAHAAGVPVEHLEDVAKSLKTRTWIDFQEQVNEAIEVASE